MSGGGMGSQGSGGRSASVVGNRFGRPSPSAQAAKRARDNMTALNGALNDRIAAVPGRTSRNGGLGGASGAPDPLIARPNGVEPKPSAPPTSKGPSGVDTGGAGTDDPLTALARASSSAARARRMRLARGGGLSNVLRGGETLG
jgi:hypothetical protein